MSDKDLCEMFGTSIDEVEAYAARYESGEISDIEFGQPVDGRPSSKLKTTSVKLFDFQLKAIDRAAREEGMTRSEFVRRAIDNELVARA